MVKGDCGKVGCGPVMSAAQASDPSPRHNRMAKTTRMKTSRQKSKISDGRKIAQTAPDGFQLLNSDLPLRTTSGLKHGNFGRQLALGSVACADPNPLSRHQFPDARPPQRLHMDEDVGRTRI